MTTATAYTANHMLTLGYRVSSSAIQSWAIVMNDTGCDLLVLFRDGVTVYRFTFRSWEDARSWDMLRQLEDGSEPVSWGKALYRFKRDGALIAA